MTASPHLKLASSNDDIVIDYSGRPRLVPDASYEAVFIGHHTDLPWGKNPVAFLRFKIVSLGEYHGTELYRPYRVKSLVGRPSKSGGQFKLSPNSLLFKDLCRVAHIKMKPSRVSLSILRNCVLEVRTRTVRRGWDQKDLPDWLQYSVIDQIVRQCT